MTIDIDDSNLCSLETKSRARIQARMEQLINLAFHREVTRRITDVILPLNDRGLGPPFYCVHAIGGVAADFRHMARMLGPEQPFYGIQAPTDKRNAEFVSSIESISQYYVSELIKFQPEGAFVLGGHSIGATIALEMSQQLIAMGREVSLLVVLDGELPNTGTEIRLENPLYWLQSILNLPRWIRDVLPLRYSFRSLYRIMKDVIAHLGIPFQNEHGKTLHSCHPVERFIDLSRFTLEHAAFMKGLYDAYLQYAPSSYSGRVLVFDAKSKALLRPAQVKAGWIKITPSADVCEVDGTHVNIMQAPRGLKLAARIRKTIGEIDKNNDHCRS